MGAPCLPVLLSLILPALAEAQPASNSDAAVSQPVSRIDLPQDIAGNVASAELEFVPLQSCRAFDTHVSSPLSSARALLISGSGNMKSQGGPKGGCGVPLYATAVANSLTASSESGSG